MASCNHDWHRTNGTTTEDGYDTYKCLKCGAVGKSYGLGGLESVFEDSGKSNKRRNNNRDYAEEYARRKFWDRLEKRIGQPSGLEWSTIQAIQRLESKPKPLSTKDQGLLEVYRNYLQEIRGEKE